MQQDSLIYTNEQCTGCNRCIAACTVPEANVATLVDGQNKIHVDPAHCINCGKCIEVCPHNARDYQDDTEAFLQALGRGEEVAALFAPAVRSNFPEFEKLLGTLRKLGCRALYDTSFGADITTWAYLRTLGPMGAKGMVSQPCPAVVNYVEKHDPSLIESLIPVHSPAMCAAVYMRKYAGVKGKIAFISPCIAKRDEFNDANTGDMVQFNVTFQKLAKALAARGIDYRRSAPDSFDNDRHWLGAIYPMPGGLKQNVLAILPDAWVYQVEGQPEVRHFLDEYQSAFRAPGEKPLLVDILNCGKGCNMGTGALCTGREGLAVDKSMHKAAAEVNNGQAKRRRRSKAGGFEAFDKKLKLADFTRRYADKHVPERQVTPAKREAAFEALLKHDEASRKVDCCSCGYDTCEEMAAAVAKGINHSENCVEYHRAVLQEQQGRMEDMMRRQREMAESLRGSVSEIFDALSENTAKSEEAITQVAQIASEVERMKENAGRLNEMMDVLGAQLEEYRTMGTQIVNISTMTKLLSLNAAVEASHARQHGKGFAVVAEEMKSLSEQSGQSANEIIGSNDKVFPLLEEVRRIGESIDSRAGTILDSTGLIEHSMGEISEAEQRITETASRLVDGDTEGDAPAIGAGENALISISNTM